MGFSDFIKKIFGEKKEAQSSFLELNEYCINKETYKRDIDETKHTKIYNEWILLRLALSYNLPLSHYNDHAKIKEIDEVLRKRISNILLSLYGEKHLDFMKDLFAQRGRQYWTALSDENPIKAIST